MRAWTLHSIRRLSVEAAHPLHQGDVSRRISWRLSADGDVLIDGEDAQPVCLLELLLRVCARVEILLATRVLADRLDNHYHHHQQGDWLDSENLNNR